MAAVHCTVLFSPLDELNGVVAAIRLIGELSGVVAVIR